MRYCELLFCQSLSDFRNSGYIIKQLHENDVEIVDPVTRKIVGNLILNHRASFFYKEYLYIRDNCHKHQVKNALIIPEVRKLDMVGIHPSYFPDED